jgi:hypothetical protein
VKRAKTERAEPAVAEVAGLEERLTREEDNELRRLGFFQQVGALSDHRRERFIELRLRDRRKEVRPPSGVANETAVDAVTEPRRWSPFKTH